MAEVLNFQGFIRGVRYTAHLTEPLRRYAIENFDINQASPAGVIALNEGEIAYSKWVSPKRTRSYPFARIYSTYNAQKVITVIPVIKDEGRDGDLDKLQFSTISWMNLLNVYIVLGYYESAGKNLSAKQRARHKLTNQLFNTEFIKSQIIEISQYRQSALHWNKNLFEARFVEIFQSALAAYQRISSDTSVEVHPQQRLYQHLTNIQQDYAKFQEVSLSGSYQASLREARTVHRLEYLTGGMKATFCIRNYLGGLYYLTADGVILQKERFIIQESKNSSKKPLPDLSDIQDGLFKLIIFANLDTLELDAKAVPFSTKLKLTGRKIKGSVSLPCFAEALEVFYEANQGILREVHRQIIRNLNLEAAHNKLEIEIGAN